jgi:CrcB protein
MTLEARPFETGLFGWRGRRVMQMVYIALFGALGCLSRYLVSGWTYNLLGRGLPYGTLAVNVCGAFLLGLIMEGGLRSTVLPAAVRMGMTTGFLGGFTTFSTFSYETVRLLEEGSLLAAGVNILLNVVICIVSAGLGIYLARQL